MDHTYINQLQHYMVQNQLASVHSGDVFVDKIPPQLLHNATNTLTQLRKSYLLGPEGPVWGTVLNIYFNTHDQHLPPSSTQLILPLDQRAVCLLAPHDNVLLSDDVTHHFSAVYDVDYTNHVITLMDPWAKNSFLLPGANVKDVNATYKKRADGTRTINITFTDFLKVLQGLQVPFNISSAASLHALESLYSPDLHMPEYSRWKYFQLLEANNIEDTAAIFSHIMQLRDPDGLLIVAGAARDIGRSGADDAADVKSGFPDIGHRALVYGQQLPWALQWLLLTRSEINSNTALQVVDAFLKDHPDDVDFQIKRADILLRLEKPHVALDALAVALAQWQAQVQTLAGISPLPSALTFFHDTKLGDLSLDILRWEEERIRLGQITASILTTPAADQSPAMQTLFTDYPRIQFEFPRQVLRILALQHRVVDFAGLVKTYVNGVDRGTLHEPIITSLYDDLITYHSIDLLSPDERQFLRTSTLGKEICSEESAGEIPVDAQVNEKLQHDLATFCGASKQ